MGADLVQEGGVVTITGLGKGLSTGVHLRVDGGSFG